MADITSEITVTDVTELCGGKKLLVITAPIAAADTTITLTAATHGITAITGCIGVITAGMDADFCAIQVKTSGLVITVTSIQEDGGAADEFTGTTIELFVIGSV